MSERDETTPARAATEWECPQCGKPNRPGQVRCVICGSAATGESEPPMTTPAVVEPPYGRLPPPKARASRPGRGRGERPWLWPTAAAALVLVSGALYWIGSRGVPQGGVLISMPLPRSTVAGAEVRAAPGRPAVAAPSRSTDEPPARAGAEPPRATVESREGGGPSPSSASDAAPRGLAGAPPAVAPPTPLPARPPAGVETASRHVAAAPRSVPTRLPPAAPPREGRRSIVPVPAFVAEPTPGPAVAAPRGDAAALPTAEPAPEPTTSTSAVDAAERAYRQAVASHNARVDEYNALVSEVYSRDAWGDDSAAVVLRERLDKARDAVESARAYAERMRARLDERRARSP